MRVGKRMLLGAGFCGLLLYTGCGYRNYTGPLYPAPEADNAADFQVSDEGTVTFVKGRLEISLRPMTDEELNRQFQSYSRSGVESVNPYTFGDWEDPELGQVPSRFTVFLLRVKNYMYPKMQVDPTKTIVLADNGRRYTPLTLHHLEEYYLRYVVGYTGNRYVRHKERMAILRNSLYRGNFVFSGQEAEGFIVFPLLHHDVQRVTLRLQEVVLRFDVWDEPVEMIDVEYVFEREIGRILADGQIAITHDR